MSRRAWDGVLRAGTALGLLVIASAQADAGGFAVREQSPYGQGSSFAGVAAGGALSSMFWNPATMTQFQGIVSETDVSGIFPHASNTPTGGTLAGPPFNLPGALIQEPSGLIAGYTSYQFSPNLWLGMSINAPFGLNINYPDAWAGRNYGGQTLLKTYNATPTIAWRINDWISVGAGVQIQNAKASLELGIGPATGVQATVRGTGMAYGATAGVTLTPTPTTTIGLGWRSGLNQKIDGVLVTNFTLPGTTVGSAETTLDLPDVVSLGIRQRLDPRWTVMGTAEWSNWSRIGTSAVNQLNGAPATVLAGFGGGAVTIPFQYRDGWFFSGGVEYIWSDQLTVRGGVGYEISPVTDQVRVPIVPDNNRVWGSIGATWQVMRGMHFDVAYSHIWVQDPNINITPGNPFFIPGLPYVGTVDAHVDVLSAALVIRLDDLDPVWKKPYMK
jgi:long-chain fatty acid transport protein